LRYLNNKNDLSETEEEEEEEEEKQPIIKKAKLINNKELHFELKCDNKKKNQPIDKKILIKKSSRRLSKELEQSPGFKFKSYNGHCNRNNNNK
jgi:hypothetical protein